MLSTSLRWTKRQTSGRRQLAHVDVAQVYGFRPAGSEVWWLSPYEFVAAWAVVAARIPTTYEEWVAEQAGSWDVKLTPQGRKYMEAHQATASKQFRLRPGCHYRLAVQNSVDRMVLEPSTATACLRRQCFLERRRRPVCLHFENSPIPRAKNGEAERNARLTMCYFRAWALDKTASTTNVPFIGDLKAKTETWVNAARKWLTHLPCKETKRYVGNFLSVYRARGTDDGVGENSDDSGVDAPLEVTAATLPGALEVSFRQTGVQQKATGTCKDNQKTHATIPRSYKLSWARVAETGSDSSVAQGRASKATTLCGYEQ